MLLFGCAKKTHIIESSKTSNHVKETSDSTGKLDLLTWDRSVTVTKIDLDTAIQLIGNTLTGALDSDDLVKHYENNDLSIDFTRDKSGLNIFFKATPKSKIVNARYHKQTTTQNNIAQSEKSQSRVGKKSESAQDSTYTHLIDHRDSSSSISSIKSVIIWSVVLLILVTVIYYIIVKKKLI